MGNRLPELVLAAIVEVEPNVPEALESELRARGDGWTAMQITLLVKHHHLDDTGTIDTFPVAQIDGRLLELGAAEHVRQQVRGVLNAQSAVIAGTLAEQGFDRSAAAVPELAVEIDIGRQLAAELSDRQPRVADVTPPPRTIEGRGVGENGGT